MKAFSKISALFLGVIFMGACNSKHSDADIQSDIDKHLGAPENNSAAAYPNVKAEVKDGVVTLTGSCDGTDCADSATARVKSVEGVKDVVNHISEATPEADLTTRTSVQNITNKYPGVQADVVGGTVVLRGTIERVQLQPLMDELNGLQLKKIDNQMVVK